MREYMAGLGGGGRTDIMSRAGGRLLRAAENATRNAPHVRYDYNARWPLPNVWLGTSIEDQATADDRIPHLLATPAAVRFLSCEPMLGPVDLTRVKTPVYGEVCALTGYLGTGMYGDYGPKLAWVICGGESGPGARVWPGFESAAGSLRDQCKGAGTAFFMKQMAGPRKSLMPSIPDDLMVREFPHSAAVDSAAAAHFTE
jgi:protein gp37